MNSYIWAEALNGSIANVIINIANRDRGAYIPYMLDANRIAGVRKKLGISQEQMARLLGVSFTSVNRWEGGDSGPTGPFRDLYLALEAAIRAGNRPEAIRRASDGERGLFLYALFRMAYGSKGRRSR